MYLLRKYFDKWVKFTQARRARNPDASHQSIFPVTNKMAGTVGELKEEAGGGKIPQLSVFQIQRLDSIFATTCAYSEIPPSKFTDVVVAAVKVSKTKMKQQNAKPSLLPNEDEGESEAETGEEEETKSQPPTPTPPPPPPSTTTKRSKKEVNFSDS
jgi:hypothetical protein